MFKENSIDNYFTDLYRMLKDQGSSQRVKTEIVSSIDLKQWLREGLDNFRIDPGKDGLYERDYKGKPFLRMAVEELGFGRATLTTSAHSQKIDIILSKACEIMVKELNTNSWMVTKILRRYLRQGQFYPTLY